jgi:hypothetical protein
VFFLLVLSSKSDNGFNRLISIDPFKKLFFIQTRTIMKKQIFTILLLLNCINFIQGQSYTFEATGITPIKLRTGANDRMIITSGGLVGIGTNSVRAKLHVYDGSAGTLPALLPTGTVSAFENNGDTYLSVLSPNNAKGGITFGSPSDVEKGWLRYNHFTNEMQLGTNSNARFYIKSGGRVGIGTANPDFNLEVNASSDAGFAVTRYSGDSPGIFGRSAGGTEATPTATQLDHTLSIFGARGHDGTGFTSSRARIETKATQNWTASANGTKMRFFTTPNGSITSSERMVIENNGDVGIGTASPQAKLDVDGDIRIRIHTLTSAGTYNSVNRNGASALYFSVAGNATLNGIAGGKDGMIVYVMTATGTTLTINNESTSANAEDRIATHNGVFTIQGRGGAMLIYEGGTNLWRLMAGAY